MRTAIMHHPVSDDRHPIGVATEPVIFPAACIAAPELPVRFAYQSTTWRARLFGVGGVAAMALVVMGGALLTWTSYQAAKPPAPALAVFDVAPPAAPPEPVRAVEPGPQEPRKERQQPKAEQPVIEPPVVRPASTSPVAAMPAKPMPDPAPSITDTTITDAKPIPPAPQPSNAAPTWQGQVLAALNKVRRYPREASFHRQQGVPYIRFVMNRDGKVLSSRLERSSGVRTLDDEALALPKRAQPLPKPPEDVRGDTIELVVPVEFFMR